MLTIRRPQLKALGKPGRELLAERAVASLRAHWPQRCFEMGADGTAALVAAAIDTAEARGFRTDQQLLRFINLAMALGAGFPQNRDMPWAREILRDARLTPDGKLDRLFEKAVRYLRYDGQV